MNTVNDLDQEFLTECVERLALLEKCLLAIELGGEELDVGLADRALEAVHSVKVCSALFDRGPLRDLAERTERALATIRWRRVAPTPHRISVLLTATDHLRALLENPSAASDASRLSENMDALARLAPAGQAAAVPRGGRLRTLLVEDEPTSRLLLDTYLSRHGDCDIAVNGREAVERFQAALSQGQPYDLICMDIMMPEMDGAEALRKVRALEEHQGILPPDGVKIVMTTAVGDFRQVAHCFRDLCDAYLVKPIDLAKLLGYLQSYGLAP